MSTLEVVRDAQGPENYNPLAKQKAAAKLSRIPVKVVSRAKCSRSRSGSASRPARPTTRFYEIKQILRESNLHTVCEEASCPNIGECFGNGTATFMIMGDKCTRRCPFCDVGHGRPDPLDKDEPLNLAKTIAKLRLKYVVITSVDRDDLRDGGSQHFVDCIRNIRELSPQTQIEILVPDFRGRDDRALEILKAAPPDVMNHNLETAPRLYKEARPGSDYQFSLNLLKKFKALHPDVPTKSGIMVGLGETDEEILQVMRDMRAHDIDMLTIGQYLSPSNSHLPVRRYVHPDTFKMFEEEAYKMGFSHAAVGAMVRSSYHADQQAHEQARPRRSLVSRRPPAGGNTAARQAGSAVFREGLARGRLIRLSAEHERFQAAMDRDFGVIAELITPIEEARAARAGRRRRAHSTTARSTR